MLAAIWKTLSGLVSGDTAVTTGVDAIKSAASFAQRATGRIEARVYLFDEASPSGSLQGTLELMPATGSHGTVTISEFAVVPVLERPDGGVIEGASAARIAYRWENGQVPISLDGIEKVGARLKDPIVLEPGHIVRIGFRIQLQALLRTLYPPVPGTVHVPSERLELNLLRRLEQDPHIALRLHFGGAGATHGAFRGKQLIFDAAPSYFRESAAGGASAIPEPADRIRLADYAQSYIRHVTGKPTLHLPPVEQGGHGAGPDYHPFASLVDRLEHELGSRFSQEYEATAVAARDMESQLPWIADLHRAIVDGAEIDGLTQIGKTRTKYELRRPPFTFFLIGDFAQNLPMPGIKALAVSIDRDHMLLYRDRLDGVPPGEPVPLFRFLRNYGEVSLPFRNFEHPYVANPRALAGLYQAHISKLVSDCEAVGMKTTAGRSVRVEASPEALEASMVAVRQGKMAGDVRAARARLRIS